MDYGYIVRWQSDLVYAIKSVIPVCDKPYHMNNGFQQMWVGIKKLWNYAMHKFIAGYKPYNLFILTVDYSKNFTTR